MTREKFIDIWAPRESANGIESADVDWLRDLHNLLSPFESVAKAARELANEATGFLGMAVREAHGNTNMAVLEGKIAGVRAALVSLGADNV